jgi:hypothetical protein
LDMTDALFIKKIILYINELYYLLYTWQNYCNLIG